MAFAIGTEIFNDSSREENDVNCAIVAGLEQQPDGAFTQIPMQAEAKLE
jgi:hypothetical protein